MSFPTELEAFRAYVSTSANNAILLVDTYDTLRGVRNAITVAHEMQACGKRLRGIRIDSGDLAWLSIQARSMLDEAGLDYVKIVASNALDEYTVRSLKEQGAAVDIWGIGTQMVTGGTDSSLDGVYKLTAVREDGTWQPRMKLSDQIAKATLPGVHGVRRFFDENDLMVADMVYATEPGIAPTIVGELTADAVMVDPVDVMRTKRFDAGTAFEDLLVPVMREGRMLGERPTLADARLRLQRDLERLDDSHKRFLRPHIYPVGIEQTLNEERIALLGVLRAEGADDDD
jgi:nicotinate phosphoribosyltransferase